MLCLGFRNEKPRAAFGSYITCVLGSCFATETYVWPTGAKFVGTYQNNQKHGRVLSAVLFTPADEFWVGLVRLRLWNRVLARWQGCCGNVLLIQIVGIAFAHDLNR